MSSNNQRDSRIVTDQPTLFIEGYFSDRINSGDRPDYGYPKNHLPPVADVRVDIEIGYLTSLKK